MIVYWLLLLWSAFVALTWKKWFIVKTGIKNNERYVRPTFFSLFCSFIPLIFIIGMRTFVADTFVYIAHFNALVPSFEGMKTAANKDELFWIVAVLIKMIWPNPNFWLTLVAVFQSVFICLCLCRYSDMPGVSFFLLIASAEIAYMFNGMRQFVAVTMCFAAFGLLEKKKYFRYILAVIFAAQFHATAYIMLFALVFVFIRPWSRQMFLIILAFGVALIFAEPLLANVQGFFEDTQYQAEIKDMIDSEGVNIIRPFVMTVPCVIAFVFRRNKALYAERKNRIAINFSVLNAMIFAVAAVVGGNLMARLAEYFTIFQLLTYPALFKNCFKGTARIAVVTGFVVLYCVWFWYQMVQTWSMYYVSDVLGWYF